MIGWSATIIKADKFACGLCRWLVGKGEKRIKVFLTFENCVWKKCASVCNCVRRDPQWNDSSCIILCTIRVGGRQPYRRQWGGKRWILYMFAGLWTSYFWMACPWKGFWPLVVWLPLSYTQLKCAPVARWWLITYSHIHTLLNCMSTLWCWESPGHGVVVFIFIKPGISVAVVIFLVFSNPVFIKGKLHASSMERGLDAYLPRGGHTSLSIGIFMHHLNTIIANNR